MIAACLARTPGPGAILARCALGVVGPAVVLAGLGWFAVASASWRSAADGGWTEASYADRQIVWLVAGVCAGVIVAVVPYRALGRRAWLFWLVTLVALAATLVIGTSVNGSRRWMDVGVVRLQPSEFAKLAVIVALARALRRADRGGWPRALAFAAAVAGLPAVLILLEPDLGTALVLVPVAAAMALAGGLPARAFACAGLCAILLAVPMALFGLKDYQRARIRAFLGQGKLAEHQKVGEAYQVIQGEIAVGAGGLTGRGYGQGTQTHLRFLPFAHTDFVFAVVAEEGGFVACTIVLGAFGWLILAGCGIAARCRDPEGRMLAIGATTLLACHAAVNLCMVVGLAPVTGIPLPFVSYGGSAMVASALAVGLICNVAARADAPELSV